MPAPAARPSRRDPEPEPNWRREFRDAAGEALEGDVVFYPTGRLGPITVQITEGTAQVALPPGTYTVAERLETASGTELPYSGSYSLTIT